VLAAAVVAPIELVGGGGSTERSLSAIPVDSAGAIDPVTN
jgi:hypothetical protein